MSLVKRYRVTFATHRVLDAMKAQGKPFSISDVENLAHQNNVLMAAEVDAYSAEDAAAQTSIANGVGLDPSKRAIIFRVEPMVSERPKAFVCSQCGKGFETWEQLNSHGHLGNNL